MARDKKQKVKWSLQWAVGGNLKEHLRQGHGMWAGGISAKKHCLVTQPLPQQQPPVHTLREWPWS